MKKVVIFSDKDNFEGSLKLINNHYGQGKKRFWDINKYIPFLMEKLSELKGMEKQELKLVKTYFYTGRYFSKLISNFKWRCNEEISKLNEMLGKEDELIN